MNTIFLFYLFFNVIVIFIQPRLKYESRLEPIDINVNDAYMKNISNEYLNHKKIRINIDAMIELFKNDYPERCI